MNALTIALFACLVVVAMAKPSIVGPGVIAGPAGVIAAVGHAGVVGPGLWGAGIGHGAWDDGQWHGEGLLASQDWAGTTAAALGAHGGWGGWGHGRW